MDYSHLLSCYIYSTIHHTDDHRGSSLYANLSHDTLSPGTKNHSSKHKEKITETAKESRDGNAKKYSNMGSRDDTNTTGIPTSHTYMHVHFTHQNVLVEYV